VQRNRPHHPVEQQTLVAPPFQAQTSRCWCARTSQPIVWCASTPYRADFQLPPTGSSELWPLGTTKLCPAKLSPEVCPAKLCQAASTVVTPSAPLFTDLPYTSDTTVMLPVCAADTAHKEMTPALFYASTKTQGFAGTGICECKIAQCAGGNVRSCAVFSGMQSGICQQRVTSCTSERTQLSSSTTCACVTGLVPFGVAGLVACKSNVDQRLPYHRYGANQWPPYLEHSSGCAAHVIPHVMQLSPCVAHLTILPHSQQQLLHTPPSHAVSCRSCERPSVLHEESQ